MTVVLNNNAEPTSVTVVVRAVTAAQAIAVGTTTLTFTDLVPVQNFAGNSLLPVTTLIT